MIFHARLLILAACFAVLRLLGSRCGVGVGVESDNQHGQNDNGSHDLLLSGYDASALRMIPHRQPPPAEQNRMHLSIRKNPFMRNHLEEPGGAQSLDGR
jgi:hypothetical protein